MQSNQTSKRRECWVKTVVKQASVVRVKIGVEWVRRVTWFWAGVVLRLQLPKCHHQGFNIVVAIISSSPAPRCLHQGFNIIVIFTKASLWPSSHHLQLLVSSSRLQHHCDLHQGFDIVVASIVKLYRLSAHTSRLRCTGASSRPCQSKLPIPSPSVRELVPCTASPFRPDYFKMSWRSWTIFYALI